MFRLLLLNVCVAVFATGCSAQGPEGSKQSKPENDTSKKEAAKEKSLDDLTRQIADEADAKLKVKPDDLDALWKKASAQFHLKDHQAARVTVDAGLKKSADDPRFRFLSGALYCVAGDSKKFEELQDWFFMRDMSYTMVMSRLHFIAKEDYRLSWHDAYQAAWLIAEGYSTPATKATIDVDSSNGAVALLSTSWSPWHTNEQNQRLQNALIAVGKLAKPMLDATKNRHLKNLEILEDKYNDYVSRNIEKAGNLGRRKGESGIKEQMDDLLSELKARRARHELEVKEIHRQLTWTEETHQKIKD